MTDRDLAESPGFVMLRQACGIGMASASVC
jgi:hypothetical protein